MNENYYLRPNFKYASPISIYHNNAILNNIKYYDEFLSTEMTYYILNYC